MKVLLVAQDIAPSLAFELLAAELKSRGHELTVLVGKGKVFPVSLNDVRNAARATDVVVSGLSSSAKLSEPEVAACDEAVKNGKLLGFYGDTYHCHERAREGTQFGPYRKSAKFFFAINETEANDAKSVLENAVRVATGNPTWEDYAFPKFTRAEVRAKYGVADDEILVLAPGIKNPAINFLNWGLLVEALAGLPKKSRIIITTHHGDRTPFAVDPDKGNAPLNIYEDLKKFSSVPVTFLPNNIKTSDVLPGADVILAWNSGSVAVEAAYQRIPIIAISTEIGRRKTYSESNTEKWEPVELGFAIEATGRNLKDKLYIYTGQFEHVNDLKKRQAEVFPKPPEKGAAVKKMADALESLIKK